MTTNNVPPVLVQAAGDLSERLVKQQATLEKEVQGLELKLATQRGQLAEVTEELELLNAWLSVHGIPTWDEDVSG